MRWVDGRLLFHADSLRPLYPERKAKFTLKLFVCARQRLTCNKCYHLVYGNVRQRTLTTGPAAIRNTTRHVEMAMILDGAEYLVGVIIQDVYPMSSESEAGRRLIVSICVVARTP